MSDKDIENVIHHIATHYDYLFAKGLFERIEGFTDNQDTFIMKLTYIYLLGVIEGKRSVRSKKTYIM